MIFNKKKLILGLNFEWMSDEQSTRLILYYKKTTVTLKC